MWKMSGLKERSGFLRLLQKTTVCRRNFASLPRQARERPGQIWLREAPVTWRSCHSAGQLFLAFGNSVPAIGSVSCSRPRRYSVQSSSPICTSMGAAPSPEMLSCRSTAVPVSNCTGTGHPYRQEDQVLLVAIW
jgi:hypothetical protein